MAHNKQLADERGVSEKDREYIDQCHLMLEELIDTYNLSIDFDKAAELCHDIEYLLQRLWKFPEDDYYHTWINSLKQKWMLLTWQGRKFRCKDTSVTIQLVDIDIYERNLVGVGNCFIDLGVANGYSRFGGNIEEI